MPAWHKQRHYAALKIRSCQSPSDGSEYYRAAMMASTSFCAAFLAERLGPDGVERFGQYGDMTDRQRELRSREIALVSEYDALAGQTFTAQYDGREWTLYSLNEALLADEIDQETYDAIYDGIAAAKNKTLGEFYLKLAAVRRELAPAMETSAMCSIVNVIVDGALQDEFQQYVYAAGDELTLEMLNGKYRELCAEYGLLGDNGELLSHDWAEIPHTFTQPCYYISYATAAAGALAVWEESQSDFYGAVDKYLGFAALFPPVGFTDRFAAVGMSNPLGPDFIKDLRGTLYERLDIEGQEEELSKVGETVSRATLAQMLYDQSGESAAEAGTFADVSPDAWYADAVAWAVDAGLITGGEGASLDPKGQTTRIEAAAMLMLCTWLEQ